MSGAWGSRISLAQRLAAQPARPLPPVPARQPDGSISAPIPLSLSDNLTVVLSLVLLSSDLTRIALLPAAANSRSEAVADGFHTPSELLLDQESLEDVANLALKRLAARSAGGTGIRVACVEHYPTLRQQWLRYTCVAVSEVPDETVLVDEARWFPLTDVMEGRVELASNGDLTRILQSITQARTHHTANNVPLTLQHPTVQQQQQPTSLSSHLSVSVVFTRRHRILLSASSPHELPSTHCDKGETLTFTAHRFGRALLGLSQTHPTILALHHHHMSAQHAVRVVCHVPVQPVTLAERAVDEACGELVEGGEETERALRSYMRLRWYTEDEVSQQLDAGAMDAFTFGCCQLAFSRMSATAEGSVVRNELGVPALHVEASDAEHQPRAPTQHQAAVAD